MNNNNICIVTPCRRPYNLESLKNSIDFDKISIWYIIYDTTGENLPFEKRYNHHKIIELACLDYYGICGNQLKNMALDIIKKGMIYFLDDNNLIHKSFWDIYKYFDYNNFYTFDMIDKNNCIILGNELEINNKNIYISQYIFDISIINSLRFELMNYNSNSSFIYNLLKLHKDKHNYINIIAAN